ncbi:DUF3885 domain-containing protein [Mucilaginibacter sp. X4EP1]|uniref:DUF3885 domain-containing protein n=1 Tax=Mucilaginibacter sp. X4EP1 TaxID=2723092 RepID=UPI0021686366|nr:DUF3885 domain-containing protein [Mucilaginibacter sp. X4EP1]MCS3816661.1 hypothetical protein [Mucilaginibacter sp. X4EP1]
MITINNTNDFELLFHDKFGDLDRSTLSKIKNKKLRIELGGEENDSKRREQALARSNEILRYCFGRKAIWLRMILWSDKEERNLENSGFEIYKAAKVLKQKDEDEILYLYFNRYSKLLLSPIAKSIINFEMAEEPSANITCYFISFNSKLIINIYDDRGLDIYTPNEELLKNINNKFSDWVM